MTGEADPACSGGAGAPAVTIRSTYNMSIRAEHLTHIYGQGTAFEQYALKDVNFEIPDGQFLRFRTDSLWASLDTPAPASPH